jgi:putative transcriptional regulator
MRQPRPDRVVSLLAALASFANFWLWVVGTVALIALPAAKGFGGADGKFHYGLTDLADRLGMTLANLSILKTNKARAIRFSTLDGSCQELRCQPGTCASHERRLRLVLGS